MTKKKKRSKGPRPSPAFNGVGFKTKDVAKAMTAALTAQHRLQFVIKWTKSRSLVLMSLQVRQGSLWIELLAHPVGGNTGEAVVEMGMFPAGTVTIRFLIGAVMEIPRVATFIVEDDQKVTPFKPTAAGPAKALKQGEQWADKGDYVVGATS